MINCTAQPAQDVENLLTELGARIVPPAGTPAAVDLSGINAFLVVAFTPTATTMTFEVTGSSVPTITGAAMRQAIAQGEDIAKTHRFRMGARRKPGTTGAIVAQTVVVSGKPGGTLKEIGRFDVEAAGTGNEPRCGYIDLVFVSGNDQFTFTNANPLTITCTAADTDIEFFFKALGTEPVS